MFKAGDKVVCISSQKMYGLYLNKTYTISTKKSVLGLSDIVYVEGIDVGFSCDRFIKADLTIFETLGD